MASSSRSARDSAHRHAEPGAGPAGTRADFVAVGRIVAAHGLRGEVRVRLETDFPHRFEHLYGAVLMHEGTTTPIVITGHRPHRGGLLLTIEGVTDAGAAGRLRGAHIAVPRDAVVPLGPDEFYVFEVIGLRVRTADGRMLGTVAEVMRGPANDVYVVRGGNGEVMIPALRAVVRWVDRQAGEMIVDLPPGLEVTGRAR